MSGYYMPKGLKNECHSTQETHPEALLVTAFDLIVDLRVLKFSIFGILAIIGLGIAVKMGGLC